MRKYTVLIVGAGNIGALFDRPGSDNVLTHAHAFYQHPAFSIAGFVDPDNAKASLAAEIWGGKAYGTVADAFNGQNIDVVCVATSDPWHYAVLKEVAEHPVRLVFAEKPLTQTVDQAREIQSLYDARRIPIVVNYSRRYVPEFINIRQRLRAGEFGQFLGGTGYYGKGLLHNGSHMIDLLAFFFDDISECHAFDPIMDYYPDDPSATAVVHVRSGKSIILQPIDCSHVTVFELDLFFTEKRLRFVNSGFVIEEYDVKDDPLFAGYRKMFITAEYQTKLNVAFAAAVTHIHDCLEVGESPLCTAQDAVQVMERCLGMQKELADD